MDSHCDNNLKPNVIPPSNLYNEPCAERESVLDLQFAISIWIRSRSRGMTLPNYRDDVFGMHDFLTILLVERLHQLLHLTLFPLLGTLDFFAMAVAHSL
jgi:hypothetical protein